MKSRAARRLLIIEVLVCSLVLTLFSRLYYVQVLDKHEPVQTAGITHTGKIVLPAARGEIVDAEGKPLVTNRATYVITVNRAQLLGMQDGGKAVLARLATLLNVSVADLSQEITPCGSNVPSPCWTGEPYQPVPVSTNANDATLLAIKEHAEDYTGVAVTIQTVRSYPEGTTAAHELGYIGQVSAADEKSNSALNDFDTIGQSGLESSYDSALRGQDGYQTVNLNALGNEVSQGKTVAATQGDTLITSIDLNVQQAAEKALTDEIAINRKEGRPATSGALVVMDPNSGRIIAAASYPTYDPEMFVGGISVADYQKLTDPSANDPLVSRAINGEYAPGSTFKLVSSTSDVMDGEDNLTKTAACPPSMDINGEVKTNYDSESPGYDMTLAQALQYSCDTYFYNYAVEEYNNDQNRIAAGKKPLEQLQHMARAFGFASSADVDLPQSEQAVGAISDRETRVANWNANKKYYCADAKTGYPDEKDPTMRAYLVKLASENCTDGWRYRAGDNADLSIGQGDTLVSPLQLAVAYSAMVNGGTVYDPTIGWAEANPAGKIVKTIQPAVKNKVPVSKTVLKYFENAMTFNPTNQPYVSGNIAFLGSPIVTQISGKTGTAEVQGKNDTSWFASWGPTTSSKKFVMVGMVEQTGTGATAAAPMSRTVWEQLLGASGKALLPGAQPITTLPKVTPSMLAQAAAQAAANAAKSGAPSPTATHGSLATTAPTPVPTATATATATVQPSPTAPPSSAAHLVSPDVVPTQTPGKRR